MNACKKKDTAISIGANIYTFADNFMNGAVRPTLAEYAESKSAGILLPVYGVDALDQALSMIETGEL